MKKLLPVFLTLGLVACNDNAATSGTPVPPKLEALKLEDINFGDYSKAAAQFTGLKEGQSRGEAIDNIRLYFAPEDGATIVSTKQTSFEREDGAVLLFSAFGLPDDSIKAEEIYIILSGAKGQQTLGAYGARVQCHGGKNTTQWQSTPCP